MPTRAAVAPDRGDGVSLRALAAISLLLAPACSDQGLAEQQGPPPDGPDIVVEPVLVELGPVGPGEQAQATLTIRNVGDANLALQDIALAEPTAGLTLDLPALPQVLAPGTQVQATVHFEAVVLQAEVELRVLSDDADEPDLAVPVQALALLPWLQIQPDPYDFGAVTPGEERPGQVLLTNVGNVDLVVDRVLMLAEHMTLAQDQSLPLTLPSGQSHTLPLSFQPQSRGDEVGQLWVGSSSWLGDVMAVVQGHGGWPGISGRVCDPSGGGWVVDATVSAAIDHDADGVVDWVTEARTDADGHYELRDLPPGTWEVSIQKGSYSATFTATVHDAGGVTELTEDTCLDPDSVRIAVVEAEWDSVEHLLRDLGLTYDVYDGANGLYGLLSPDGALDDYDVLFINCGDYRSIIDDLPALAPQLDRWVRAGGSLYVSDWAWQVVEAAWPEAIDFHGADTSFEAPAVGAAATVQADVVDTVVAYAVGDDTAEIIYDLDAWVVLDQAGEGVDVLVQADVVTMTATSALTDRPLAVRFSPGGRVVFTSFHNDRQITRDMDAALREIILSL